MQSSGWSCKAMLHLPAGFSISVLFRITTDGTPDSKEDLKARGNKIRLKKECKKQGCCRCGGKGVFSTEKRDGVQMAGEGTLDCWNVSRSRCLHFSKNPSHGFHQEGVFSRRSGAGYNNLLPAQSKKILFCAAITAVWVFDAKDF